MRKATTMLGILITVSIILFSIAVVTRPVNAEADYSIGHVFHTVKIMYNGFIFINDTFELNNVTGVPSNFLMGFPDKYGQNVLKCFAFNDTDTFPVTLNTLLNATMGFYGVRIDFPPRTGTPQVFTVGFVLSNSLLTQNSQNASLYELDFPAYPSLLKKADLCNVSIIVPQGATFLSGTVSGLAYGQQDLPELTRLPAKLDFQLSTQNQVIADVERLSRVITVGGTGEIGGTDTYAITNDAPTGLTAFQVFLPSNASNMGATDLFGRPTLALKVIDANTSSYEVDFSLTVAGGNSIKFAVTYSLPGKYITQNSNSFNLSLPVFEHENYYIDEAFISFVLPEGAKMDDVKNNSSLSVYSMEKALYQETVTLSQEGIIVLDKVNVGIIYDYNPFWASFRPTMWIWALGIVGCVAVAATSRRPKGAAKIPISPATLRLGPEFLKSFVDSYEEKKKIDSELGSLETRLEKGRIPRRRYKVMRITLETRLEAALRKLNESKERMRSAGGKYSGLMLQLEVAEAEIGEVKTNIKNAESLHNRGELSLEAYRNRLADYQRKKERAETTINGILLRLREETQQTT